MLVSTGWWTKSYASKMVGNYQTSIKKWLFTVPGTHRLYSLSSKKLDRIFGMEMMKMKIHKVELQMEWVWQICAKGKWWLWTLRAKWRCGRSNASLYSSTISISRQQLSWANLQTYRVSTHPREQTKPTEAVFKIDPKSRLVYKHPLSSQRRLAILLAG